MFVKPGLGSIVSLNIKKQITEKVTVWVKLLLCYTSMSLASQNMEAKWRILSKIYWKHISSQITHHMSTSKNLMLYVIKCSICAFFISQFLKKQTTNEDRHPFLWSCFLLRCSFYSKWYSLTLLVEMSWKEEITNPQCFERKRSDKLGIFNKS